MTDMTNNDLDSYGVWVKRSGKTNEPVPASQEAGISDFGIVNNAVSEPVVEKSFGTPNLTETPDGDSPFAISDDTIAALDEPIGKDEFSIISAADNISGESSEDEIKTILEENTSAVADITNKDDNAAPIVSEEDEEMPVPVFDDSMFESVDDTVSSETDDNEIDDTDYSDNTTAAQNDNATQSSAVSSDTAILQQIMAELSSLKSEIAALKTNFEELKNKPVSDFIPEPSVNDNLGATSSAGGFFSDDDEDETISLSGDELSNIMSSANFSDPEIVGDDEQVFDDTSSVSDEMGIASFDENSQTQEDSVETEEEIDISSLAEDQEDSIENEEEEIDVSSLAETEEESTETEEEEIDVAELAETPDASVEIDETVETDDDTNIMEDLSADVATFDDDSAVEESDDDVDETVSLADMSEFSAATGIIADDNLPDEISVAKIDDVIVGSSDSDFFDSVQETDDTEEMGNIDFDIPEELPDDAVEPSAQVEDDVNFSGEVSLPDDHPAVADLMSEDPDIHEAITDNHLDYLKTDENATLSEDLGFAADIDAAEADEKQTVEETAETTSEEVPEQPRSFVDDLIDTHDDSAIPTGLKSEIKSVLLYMDQLLESLPEEKIVEFAQSEQFNTYKKLFSDLGLS